MHIVVQYKADLRALFSTMSQKQQHVMAIHLGFRCSCLVARKSQVCLQIQTYLFNMLSYVEGYITLGDMHSAHRTYFDRTYRTFTSDNPEEESKSYAYIVDMIENLCLYDDFLSAGLHRYKTNTKLTRISDFEAKIMASFLAGVGGKENTQQHSAFIEQELCWQRILATALVQQTRTERSPAPAPEPQDGAA